MPNSVRTDLNTETSTTKFTYSLPPSHVTACGDRRSAARIWEVWEVWTLANSVSIKFRA